MNPTLQQSTPTTLAEIEKRTRAYADARDVLSGYVTTLNDKIETAKRNALADIKRAVNRTAEREAELRFTIETAPELFERPRTVIFHGVKVGFQKGKGTLEVPDEDRTRALVRKLFPDCLRVKESLNKEALADLAVADLKRVGVNVTETGDVVVIKPTDTAVDKIVNALLKDAVEEATK